METILIFSGFGLLGFIAYQVYQAFDARRDLNAFEAQYQQPEEPLFQRMRSAGMQEIISAADKISFEELKQAAIRLGKPVEIAEAYAEQILDDLYPSSEVASPTPNMGGLDSKTPFRGPVPNFNRADLTGVPYFPVEHNNRRTVRDAEARGEDPYQAFAKGVLDLTHDLAAPLIGIGDPVEVMVARLDRQVPLRPELSEPNATLPLVSEWIPATVVNLDRTKILVAFSDGERMVVPRKSNGWRKVS